MKVSFIKPVDSSDDFQGVSIIAEDPKEKQLIKKLANANYIFKISEKQMTNLKKKQVVFSIEIINVY